MKSPNKPRLSPESYIKGILEGDRVMLGKAITLIESARADDQVIATEVLNGVISKAGNSIRIGISGVPGVGKSTFIESFGKLLTSLQNRVAVLTIDPSSQRTSGSILGDKTRMEELAKDPLAFIRPSASGKSLGGVAAKTREAIILCEAAGFNIIIIETVGVGQSETDVKNMVDFFLLLMLPGAGDELQGIKKGIMEMADLIVINKADTDNLKKVQEAKHHYKQALHLFVTSESGWNTKVLSCSALEKTGIEEIWKEVKAFEKLTHDNGYFLHNRKLQNISWMQSQLNFLLQSSLKENDNLKKLINQEEQGVAEGKISATAAARNIFNYWIDSLKR